MTDNIINLLIGIAIGAVIASVITWLITRVMFSKEREDLRVKIAEMQKERDADVEKLKWLEAAEAKMRDVFEALASRSLQNNSDNFIGRAQEQIAGILDQVRGDWGIQKAEIKEIINPLQQNLSNIDGYVRELEKQREGAYQGVTEQLRQLNQAQSELRNTTITLAQALKSSTIRGRWGEIQLRRIAEMSGMEPHISFNEQVTVEDGRPDMIVRLPNGGIIPIDSKSPMGSYFEAMSSNDDRIRVSKMQEHVKAIRSRIHDLNKKQYWKKFDSSPEFVVMFIPSEACLSAAFEIDSDLMEYAIEQKIMIATPITLLALLKSIAYGWQQHQVTENARAIANEGKELCKRLETFVEHLSKVGEHLNKSVKVYNDAVGSFQHRLLPSARRFETLGATTSELVPPETLNISARQISSDSA